MDKKGLNFMAGLGGLWLVWRLYALGVFSYFGFMAVNQMTGGDISYSMQDGVMTDTPLAVFASLAIDVVAIFGSILIMLVTGIWQTSGVLISYIVDLLKIAKYYIDKYMGKVTPETPVPDIKMDTQTFFVQILEVLKSIQARQDVIEQDIANKVDKTQIVSPPQE